MEKKRKTPKKDMFTKIRDAMEMDIANNHENSNFNEYMVAFINYELELLSKKSASKKPTATQIANEGLKATILEVLKGANAADAVTMENTNGMTASEVLASSDEFAGLSNQKITALLRQLVLDGSVTKITDNKKTLFKLA